MSAFRDVHIALDRRLSEKNETLDIAWENIKYTPTKGTAYIRPTVLMSPSNLLDLNKTQYYNGIYQIDIFYPAGEGSGNALEKADELTEHFKEQTEIDSNSTTIYIKHVSRVPQPQFDGPWYIISIEINFECYSN